MNERLTSVVTLAWLVLTTGFSCSAQLTTGEGVSPSFPPGTYLYYCGVMDYLDLRFPSFLTLGWFTTIGENGLWILLE